MGFAPGARLIGELFLHLHGKSEGDFADLANVHHGNDSIGGRADQDLLHEADWLDVDFQIAGVA